MKLAVIVPTYNERQNIESLVLRIIDVFKENNIAGSIIIVDDSSPDGTGDIAKELSEKFENVVLINRKEKLGIGSAYKEGYSKACSLGFEGMMEMDADGSHDPSIIPRFVEKLEEGFDLVIGSRYVDGARINNWPIDRRIISRTAAFLIHFMFGSKIQDPTSGFRCISQKALNMLDLSKIYSAGYSFQVEISIRCEKLGLRVSEIPIKFIDRSLGASKLSFREMLRFFKEIIELSQK